MMLQHLHKTPELKYAITLLVAVVFAIDIATGYEISISIFYLVPIGMVTWVYSGRAGLLLSVLCAGLWLIGERLGGATYSNDIIPVWNMLVRLGFFVIVTVTLATRRRVEKDLLDARAEALAASSAKSEFVNRVTHELRTPLTSILGFTDVLTKQAAPYLTAHDQECLRRIRANSESLMRLVDGVLDIGRAELRTTPPKREPVDVATVMRAVARDIGGIPFLKGLDLRVDAPVRVPPIETDPDLLRQILLNLVSNAVKFTEEGEIRMALYTAEDGSAQAVQVEDSGIGIPPDRLQTIFRPFEQAGSNIHRQFGGVGLGLTIAKDLADLLGFHLEVESRLGVGSTFRLVFPQADA